MKKCALLLVASLVFVASGQSPLARNPRVGYVYPAGGQQGSVVQVTAGGQALAGAATVYLSGEGVRGTVTYYAKPLNNQQLQTLGRKLKDRRDELAGRAKPAAGTSDSQRVAAEPPNVDKDLVPLPNHPWIQNIETMTMDELERVARRFFDKKNQLNAQIAEIVLVDVTIDPAAVPGVRELRLKTAAGLTNPIPFHVGTLPETSEVEPNDPRPFAADHSATEIGSPTVVNGQIMPGDLDRFMFQASAGQSIVARARARELVPYLADAVPGWFQAVLTLYDGNGRRVASADDQFFSPDPVLACTIPKDGTYVLETRDALFRGREDFVYRIALDNTESGSHNSTRPTSSSPETNEIEPNNTGQSAQAIAPPCMIEGTIDREADADVYRFEGKSGMAIVAEVYARRLDSPLDSLLRLTDSTGNVLAWNDDHPDAERGLITHHADSYVTAQLPADGAYCVEISDAQHNAGPDFRYTLRISPPQPDFALRIAPSSINVQAGRSAVVHAYALRKDGFTGEIRLAIKGDPAGLTLDGATIPAGADHVRMTLTAARASSEEPISIEVEGRAEIARREVCRRATPAEDMMQAFSYRHLVTAENLLVSILGPKKPTGRIALASDEPVRIPLGGAAQIYVKAPIGPILSEIELRLSDPPKGIALTDVVVVPDGMVLEVAASPDAAAPGLSDNLIVEAYREVDGPQRTEKPSAAKRQVPVGVLPAIPFEVAAR